MTDKEIIQSFIDNNQHGIREVYYAWRVPFEQSLMRLLPNTDDMEDAYQEAFIRLQQHILTERLTADNIQKSLLAYFKTIGRYVALEMINQRNKGQNQPNEDEDEDIDAIDIKEELEFFDDPMDNEPQSSNQSFDPNDDMDTQERERIIRSLVEQLGKPCAPLLLGHLWENKSMEILAQELGYSNADSAKSQKAKCMKKVKTFVKQQLIEYGYGY
jgi:RNA polymerase sigma factor (sigma-70 family)